MFGLGPATKIYIAVEGVDMRKGFDGLFGLVHDRLGQDPLSGHLFLFSNRARSRLKVLVWDGSGLWVCAKRLEKGRFRWPAAKDGNCIVMRPEEMAMLVNGLDLADARPAQELAAAHAGGLKHFRVLSCERTGNDSQPDLQSNLLPWLPPIHKRTSPISNAS